MTQYQQRLDAGPITGSHVRGVTYGIMLGVLLPAALVAQQGAAPIHPGHPSAVAATSVQVIEPPFFGPDSLLVQLHREADSAAAHGQLALVDVGATWCGPCQEFQATFHDPVMVAALRGARVIHLDFNIWYTGLVEYGYLSAAYDLPELFLLTRTGELRTPFNRGRWQDYIDSVPAATPAQYMGLPLQAFLAEERAKPAKQPLLVH